ncbi:hypothetical protein F4818DRAFT_128913 [Hypoxylon cercidicola]|nr:hypothetical protein F4818DRAFT_128913 [Hypoxylon cercidicola]
MEEYGGFATAEEYDNTWSVDEDVVLFNKRLQDHSWDEITLLLRRDKKEIKTRFKYLMKYRTRTESDGDEPAENKDSDKKAKKPHAASASASASSNSDSDSSSGSSTPSPYTDANGDVFVYGANRAYLNSLTWQYSDRACIPADHHFSVADCQTLAVLEARHRADKWLNIAADFAAMTGRMVGPEILEAKFAEREKEEEEDDEEESEEEEDSGEEEDDDKDDE